MISLTADENFNNRIVRGLIRRNPRLQITRIQDSPLSGAPDSQVLAWLATVDCVLVTHDVSTMIFHARRRIEAGLKMAGIVECPTSVPIGVAIEDLLLIAECSENGEWNDRILFLPL